MLITHMIDLSVDLWIWYFKVHVGFHNLHFTFIMFYVFSNLQVYYMDFLQDKLKPTWANMNFADHIFVWRLSQNCNLFKLFTFFPEALGQFQSNLACVFHKLEYKHCCNNLTMYTNRYYIKIKYANIEWVKLHTENSLISNTCA